MPVLRCVRVLCYTYTIGTLRPPYAQYAKFESPARNARRCGTVAGLTQPHDGSEKPFVQVLGIIRDFQAGLNAPRAAFMPSCFQFEHLGTSKSDLTGRTIPFSHVARDPPCASACKMGAHIQRSFPSHSRGTYAMNCSSRCARVHADSG